MNRQPVQKKKTALPGLTHVKRSDVVKAIETVGIPLIFFVGFFLFLKVYLDPSVIHTSNGFSIHTFVTIMHAPDASSYADLLYRHLYLLELTPEYLREIACAPGGFVRGAVTLIIYACHYPVAGALCITGLALFFFWIFLRYLSGLGVRRPELFGYVPAFFLLTVCAWYELNYSSFLLPVVGALALAVIYQRLRPSPFFVSNGLLSLLFWIAWYVMQWGALLFVIFVIIHHTAKRSRTIVPVVLACALHGVLLYIAETRFVPLKTAVRWSEFLMLSSLPLAAIGFFPLAALVAAIVGKFTGTFTGKKATVLRCGRAALLVCGTVAAAVWLIRDPINRDTRTIARTVHHVMNGKWNAVLAENTAPFFTGFPENAGLLQVFMMQSVNHALSNNGQLGERLFTYPQALFSYDPLLMLQSMTVHGYVNWFGVLDLAMDLGMVNTAEKVAAELMENMGPYPAILYRRALVQIAKGNREAGAVYLGRLSHMPFYRTEARRLLDKIDNDRALFSEPRIARMSALKDTVDYFLNNNLGADVMLRNLLQSNSGNKAAFDYLITYCLLYDQLAEAAHLLSAAPSFGYQVLPRYWEEALCYYRSINALQASTDPDYSGIRQERVAKFYQFTKSWMPLQGDPQAAEKLKAEFGDSYYYFSVFRYTPGVTYE